MRPDIIFDLDGTLIDSAPGILAGFAGAFSACGCEPKHPLTPGVIGPPLMETLAGLAGTDDARVLQALAAAFKAHYDEIGYRQTLVFAGVSDMLAELVARGHVLHIATNKRILPTRRILAHLGWERHFGGVYALDAFDPPLPSKARMLGEILARRKLDAPAVLYVGDRQEDGAAAEANAMPFLLAAWGYDEPDAPRWERVQSPAELLAVVSAA